MSVFSIVLLLVMIVAYTGQDFFKKIYAKNYRGAEKTCVSVYSILYGAIIAGVTFVYNGFRFAPDTYTLIFGLCNAISVYMYNMSVIRACQTGPYSFMNLMCILGGILLPTGISLIIWRETLTVIQVIGIALLLITFIFYSGKGDRELRDKKYLIWVALSFVSNGLYAICMDAQSMLSGVEMRNEMIMTVYILLAVFSAVELCLRKEGSVKNAFCVGKRALAFASMSAVCGAIAVNALMLAFSIIPTSVLMPTQSAAIFAFNMILSIIVLRERINRRQAVCIILMLIGMVLLNI